MSGIRRQQRSVEGWRALLAQFGSSGLTVTAFCKREAISPASVYRWRSLLGATASHVPVVSALPLATAPTGFVDLGALISPPPSSPSFELHLDLGSGLMLHLVRH